MKARGRALRLAAGVFLLGLGLQCVERAPQTLAGPPRIEPSVVSKGGDESMSNIDFGLADEEFWTAPKKSAMAVAKQLWKENRDITAVGAPKRVEIDKRSTLPVMIYRGGSYRDLWALSFSDHAMVVAVDVEQNRAYASRVVTEDMEPPPEPVDVSKAPKGNSTDSALLELREAMQLPWQPSTYVVTVILRDMVSNRAKVELGKSPSRYHDEEVAKFLASQRASQEPARVEPAPLDPLPSFKAMAGSPPIPAELGLSLAADRLVVMRAGMRCVVKGSFRLKAKAHEIVKSPEKWKGVFGDNPPSAVVGIALFVVGADDVLGGLMHLAVPSWDKIDPANPIVTGYFALDLLAAKFLPEVAQTYFLYGFSSEWMVGPVPSALVAQEAPAEP